MNTMPRHFSNAILVGTLAFTAAACGSSQGDANAAAGFIMKPNGFPLVTEALSESDLCGAPPDCALARNPPPGATTVQLGQTQSGPLCFRGRVGDGGFAALTLIFTQYDGEAATGATKVLKTFDAKTSGVAQVAFDIDRPASDGISIWGYTVKQPTCPMKSADCRAGGYVLMTKANPPEPVKLFAAGEQKVPLDAFVETDLSRGPSTFDTSALDAIALAIQAATFDFCVSRLRFLDAAGAEVTP